MVPTYPRVTGFWVPGMADSACPLLLAESVSAEELEEDKEHTCETLLMCIVTVLSHGLRSGGGVGDVLRKPSKEVQRGNRGPQASPTLMRTMPGGCFPVAHGPLAMCKVAHVWPLQSPLRPGAQSFKRVHSWGAF